jgi:hypothetical protein
MDENNYARMLPLLPPFSTSCLSLSGLADFIPCPLRAC